MADVKWIKIATDIFDDEKILLIEGLPEADTIITIWFKLLCLAGKQNNSGVFLMNDKIAYTDKMLSIIFRRKESSVQLALKTFEEFGMIEIINDVITIPNWSKHQKLDAYENKKEYDRKYSQQKRLEQKKKAQVVNDSTTSSTTVGIQDIDIDKEEEDKDIDKNNNSKEYIVPSDNSISQNSSIQSIFNLWNECKITIHKTLTEEMIKAITKALNIYGEEKIFEGIKHYYIVFKDKKYFFKYKWKLVEFLNQSNALPTFFAEGDKWTNYINSDESKKNQEKELLGNKKFQEEILNDFCRTR